MYLSFVWPFSLYEISFRKCRRTCVYQRRLLLQLFAAVAAHKSLHSVSPKFSWMPSPRQPRSYAKRRRKGALSPKPHDLLLVAQLALGHSAKLQTSSRGDLQSLNMNNYSSINSTQRPMRVFKMWTKFQVHLLQVLFAYFHLRAHEKHSS